MKKQPEVTARTRQKLIDAFWQVYREKPLAAVTVREITALAGYNRGTFYQYFPDVYAVVEEEIHKILDDVRQAPFEKASDHLEAFLPQIIRLYQLHSEQFCLLVDRGDSRFVEIVQTELFPVVMSKLGIENNLHNRLVLIYGFNGLINALSYWHKNRTDEPIEYFVNTIYGAITRGALTLLVEEKN